MFQEQTTTESVIDTCFTTCYLQARLNSHKNFVSCTYEKSKSLSSLIFSEKICCHWTCLAHSNLICLLMPVPQVTLSIWSEILNWILCSAKATTEGRAPKVWDNDDLCLPSSWKPMTNTMLKHLSNTPMVRHNSQNPNLIKGNCDLLLTAATRPGFFQRVALLFFPTQHQFEA